LLAERGLKRGEPAGLQFVPQMAIAAEVVVLPGSGERGRGARPQVAFEQAGQAAYLQIG